jgi:hypothetical protein
MGTPEARKASGGQGRIQVVSPRCAVTTSPSFGARTEKAAGSSKAPGGHRPDSNARYPDSRGTR